MDKKIILIILFVVFIAGCEGQTVQPVIESRDSIDNIIPICDDNVVCYYRSGYQDGGMSCIKDITLSNKYCK